MLVRPHPYNGQAWRAQDFDGLDGVAVWPRGGYDPIDEANRIGLFDSLHYCDAVVGINTSAMIEAAIVGRPVLAIETPEFAGSQDGTLHYRHLLPENGGFLRVASSFDAHVDQLAGVLRDPDATREEIARFVAQLHSPEWSRHAGDGRPGRGHRALWRDAGAAAGDGVRGRRACCECCCAPWPPLRGRSFRRRPDADERGRGRERTDAHAATRGHRRRAAASIR